VVETSIPNNKVSSVIVSPFWVDNQASLTTKTQRTQVLFIMGFVRFVSLWVNLSG
jgi:hypothetical protein